MILDILSVWLLLVVLLSPAVTALAAEEAGGAEIDLYSLSDAELEEICTARGFELVHDDTVFTHDDFVEAARQCLAIEQDMEEIIAEHPEILGELEEERDRMLAEKERLEQELAEEAEKRADGRQPPPAEQHAAFVTHTEGPEEIMDLDEEDGDFDVVGHQEPLSDSRVHEEEIVNDDETASEATTSNDDSASQQVGTNNNDENASIGMVDTIREFKERIVHDFNAVADVVFPKSMRGPTKEALIRAGRIVKREAMNVYKFVMRYIKTFIEKRKNTTAEEIGESAVASSGGGGIEQETS